MKIEIFTAFSPELEEIWREFETEAVGTPFQSYAWLSHWQNTVGSPLHSIQPQLVIVRDEIETLAVFPLGIRNVLGVSILEWLGGLHSDYMGPLLNEEWEKMEKDFPLCWLNIINKLDPFDVIHFQKQKEHIGSLQNPFVSSTNCENIIFAYHVNLKNSWKEHYEKTIKTKLRTDSRRQRRRLADMGKLCFEVVEDKGTKKRIINKMIDQKSRRYRDTCAWDMLSVLEHKVFYEKLADITDDSLKIHCAELCVGETTIATHVGLVDQSTFYYLIPAHEGGNWERYSPGRLLLEHLLEWSIQNKLKVFDFTIGGEHYKKDWCDTETPLFEILKPFTLKGKMYVMAQHTKQTVKDIPWLGKQAKQFNSWLINKGVLPNKT